MKTSTAPFVSNDSDKELPKMILASISFHVSIFCVFALKILFFPTSDPIVYKSSVRVDLVALPDKQTNAAPAPSKADPVKANDTKPLPKTIPKIVKEPTKIDLRKKENKSLERLKALQEIEEEMKRSKSAEKSRQKIKGNVLAAGTSIKGLNKLDYDTYIGDIDAQIKGNWILPEWLAKAGLRAQALVRIDERGYVIKKELILSSKNPTYDSLVMEAIDRSSPFPAPPEKFVNIVGVDGIIFQFPD